MWVAKFKFYSDNYGKLFKEIGINAYAYPLSSYHSNGKSYYVGAAIINTSEENRNKIFNYLKNDPSIKRIEIKNEFIMVLREYEQNEEFDKMYNPEIIHISPIYISPEGYEVWHVACWDRKPINELLDIIEHKQDFELLKMRNMKISNIFTNTLIVNISEKQRIAIDLAIKNGYYNYPRKTDLRFLAKKMNVSLSTYREHLRKAESKLLPFVMRNHDDF